MGSFDARPFQFALSSLLFLLAYTQPIIAEEISASDLFERISPSVVKLIILDEDDNRLATGSAFVVNLAQEDTDVLFLATCYHSIRGAYGARVEFIDGQLAAVETSEAEDENMDLAVLSVSTQWKPPRPIDISHPKLPPIGTKVFVIGSPRGLTNTLSEGLVSGYRDSPSGGKWIQLTAPISPGSSGGPVLTGDGKLVGVAIASLIDGQNLNFAVPASALQQLVRDAHNSRPLWKGSSILQEARVILADASAAALQIRKKKNVHDDGPLPLESEVRSGNTDQLLLLAQALEELKHNDIAVKCRAFESMKQSLEARPGEFEYLASYKQGTMLAGIFCRACFGDSAPSLGAKMTSDQETSACYDPAIRWLKKSIALNSQFSPALCELADIYLLTERYLLALEISNSLVSLVPNSWKAYLQRGTAFARLGRSNEADNDFATALRLRPNSYFVYSSIAGAWLFIDNQKSIEARLAALSLPLPMEERKLRVRQATRAFDWQFAKFTYELLGDAKGAAQASEEIARIERWRSQTVPNKDASEN